MTCWWSAMWQRRRKTVQKHLQMLDGLRTALVKHHYPAKLINRVSQIYLQGLQDSKPKRQRRKAYANG